MNVFQSISDRSIGWKNHPAIHDKSGTISFLRLLEETRLLAKNLEENGLKPGMGFGIISQNSRDFIIAILAGLKCETVVMPISSDLTSTERKEVILRAGLHAILDLTAFGIKANIEFPKAFDQRIAPHVPNAAFIRFTSGTTGKSKGVIISHESVIERIEAANKGLRLTENEAVVWVLPIAYHFVVSIILYLYNGTAIILSEDFLAESIIRIANRFKGTMLYASPMHIRLLASHREKKKFETVKRVISTSATLPPLLCGKFNQKFGIEVCQAFGIIEVGLPIINFNKATSHPEAVGFSLPDYTVANLKGNKETHSHGIMGQLAIKGPGLFDGYLEPPSSREENLQNGWFLTGDLATISAEGLITIEGRSKSVINVSGNKVFPEEVENVLDLHSSVIQCRVYSGSHRLTGEIVEAEVIAKANADIEEIITHCRKYLSPFKVPQRIQIVDEIEMTGSGKVKR